MSDQPPSKSRLTTLPRAALLGFALSGIVVPRESRAYYLAGWLLLSATTTGVGATIAVGVYITVKTVEAAPTFGPGDTARTMIEAALVSMRGDFAMQVDLLLTSPTAFAQLDREMALGGGSSVDTLVQATGLGAEELGAAWARARTVAPTVSGPEDARAVVIAFVKEIGPSLQVPSDVVAGLSWQLVGEADQVSGGRTTAQLAHWLGVAPADLVAATKAALGSLGMDGGTATRARLYEDPDGFLDALARELEVRHGDVLAARMAEVVRQARPVLAPTAQTAG